MIRQYDPNSLKSYKQARDEKVAKAITIAEFALAALIVILFCATLGYSVEQDIIQLTGWTGEERQITSRDVIMNALQLIEAVAVVTFVLLNALRMIYSTLPQQMTFFGASVTFFAALLTFKITSIPIIMPSILYTIAIFGWITSHFYIDFKKEGAR